MATKKVIATARGYHGGVIEPGQTFEIDATAKGSWFEPVTEKKQASDTLRLPPRKDGKNGDADLV